MSIFVFNPTVLEAVFIAGVGAYIGFLLGLKCGVHLGYQARF